LFIPRIRLAQDSKSSLQTAPLHLRLLPLSQCQVNSENTGQKFPGNAIRMKEDGAIRCRREFV